MKDTTTESLGNFKDFGLPAALADSIARMRYEQPTPIQAQTIPLALEGKDILGSAQTGTGKTAAFMIPLIVYLLRAQNQESALVLTPTRELADQVLQVAHQLLGLKSAIRTALLIGGAPMGKQLSQLRSHPRLIVGTPGRINDHLERGTLTLDNAKFLVLDETDRMLDMGFGIQLDAIVPYLSDERQTLLFSATIPSGIARLAQKYTRNAVRVAVGSVEQPALNIKQDVIHVLDQASKYAKLLEELDKNAGSTLVFVKTRGDTERLAGRLPSEYKVDFIHGDLQQSRRNRVIKGFREGRYQVLIATDVVARGIDIPHISRVINYNLPQSADDYLHRIGRTARAGASGSSLCLVSPDERRLWREIKQRYFADDTSEPKHYREREERSSHSRYGGERKRFDGDRRPSSSNGYNDRRKKTW